ncbi:MAG: hypothetical protein QOG90_408 [Actinomycetota bacterium]|jgi:hypothetical protein
MARKRSRPVAARRRLRREDTVEAAVARAAGLNVRDQLQLARNASVWGASVAAVAAACLAPSAVGNLASVWGLFEGLTIVPAGVLVRRAWMLQRGLRYLDETDDPAITVGDEGMAHLRELVKSLDSKPAIKAGKAAIAAAAQAYLERARILERRGHVEALLVDNDPGISDEELAHGLDSCNQELAAIDEQIEGLILAVAHLANSSDQSAAVALTNVRDATDSVQALASGFDELAGQ